MDCPQCGASFFIAPSASSKKFGKEIIDGVECPKCGMFISDDELDELDDEAAARDMDPLDLRDVFGPYSSFSERGN